MKQLVLLGPVAVALLTSCASTGSEADASPPSSSALGADGAPEAAAAATVALDAVTTDASSGIASPWTRQKTEPDASQGAFVAQNIGVDGWVQIAYHRPGVKGRDVWTATNSRDELIVPRDGDPVPWRLGANEATTIEFTDDVLVEGQPLAAGRYALYAIPTDGDWTLAFQGDADQWGSRRYDASNDALRVTVTPEDAPHTEWLAFGFDDPLARTTTAWFRWAELKVPFRIEMPQG